MRVTVLNDSAQVLKLLCNFLQQQGHVCASGLVADMPNAHEEVERFITKSKPDVVVYDVAMPYGSSWDLLDVIRMMPSLRSQPFVITTPNKRKLEQVVGETPALEISGRADDLGRLLKAVEAAARRSQPE